MEVEIRQRAKVLFNFGWSMPFSKLGAINEHVLYLTLLATKKKLSGKPKRDSPGFSESKTKKRIENPTRPP